MTGAGRTRPVANRFLLLERHGDAGKATVDLDLPVRSGPVIVEAEQPRACRLSVTAKRRYQLVGDPLLQSFDRGPAGRAWTFLRHDRPTRLSVKAEGAWTLRVRGIEAATPFHSTASGTGCDVLAYPGPAADAVVEYRKPDDDPLGVDSIMVHMLPAGAETEHDVDWLFVSQESVRRTVRLPGPCLLFIRTDGLWSLTTRVAA
jgi:hypothetical protein